MSSKERRSQDRLESLIAEILDAESRGESPNRDAIIDEHPDLAESLRDFFANHDRMKAAAGVDEPSVPPGEHVLDDPTISPGQGSHDQATIPPGTVGVDPTGPPTKATSPPEASVGDHIRYFGDYELLEEIARGGMGVVFKARQINLNRIVALKMILAGQFAGQEDVQRFYTEAEAAANLDHPGIVPIFEIGEHRGQHYFSMGYFEGESLAQKVADGPLPPREAAELVRKICEAMAYAHERGVIHRDLKPANILIDRNGQPKVTDFGLAKRTEADSNLTGTGQILGTPAYMPPEQASGNVDVGPLADVYSLGAMLYCLLTGRPPFQAASPMDTLLQVLNQEPVPLRLLNAKIPQDLESVVLKCLQKSPGHRYESCASLRDELQRFLNGEPTLAKPVGSIRYTWNWYWHNLTKVAGSLAIACSGLYAICTTVGLFHLFVTTSEGPASGTNGKIENMFMSLMFMVPVAIFALIVVLIGAKCGLLTLRGHKLGILGSICVLGFITLSIASDFSKFPEDASSELRRSATLLTSYAYTFAIWYAFCLLTQFLALLTPNQRASIVALADDVATIRRDRSRLVQSFIFMAFGVAMIASARLSDLTPPGIGLAGLMLVLIGILIAFRLR